MFGLQRGRYIFFPNYNLRTLNIYSGHSICNFREKWKIPLIEKYIYNKLHALLVQIKFNLYFVYSLSCQTDYIYSLSTIIEG